MSPASVSHEDEEVRMGRTKHGLPPRSVRKYVRAYPGMFYETPDGKIGGLPEGANITPLRRPEEPS